MNTPRGNSNTPNTTKPHGYEQLIHADLGTDETGAQSFSRLDLDPQARTDPRARQVTERERDGKATDLVLGVELLLELGDLPLLGGREILGVVAAHLAPASRACTPCRRRSPPPPAAADAAVPR